MEKAQTLALVLLLEAPGLVALAGVHWTWVLVAGFGVAVGIARGLLATQVSADVRFTSHRLTLTSPEAKRVSVALNQRVDSGRAGRRTSLAVDRLPHGIRF